MIKCKKCGEEYVSAYRLRLPRDIIQTGGNSKEIHSIDDCHVCRPPEKKDES